MNHIHIIDNIKVKKHIVIGQCGISYLLVQHQKISEIIAIITNTIININICSIYIGYTTIMLII